MFQRFGKRRATVPARLVFVVLLAFAVAVCSVAAPSGAAARTKHKASQSASTEGVAGGAVRTVTSDLNLREGPSTDTAILAVMPAGATVQIAGDPENGFYPVSYGALSGYAAGDYLSAGGAAAPADPAPAAPATDGSGLIMAGAGYGDIVSIIYAAAAAYGQSGDDMLRVAICESGLDPNNVTPPYDASGLFQFLPGTWASTPYAGYSVFDPVANANAAAWMWAVGRRGEWVCQ